MVKSFIPSISAILFLGFAAIQPDPAPSTPNFAQDIAPIIKAKCLPCHQPGGIGPFDFTTARNFNRHIELIRVQLLARLMPPTPVTSDYGPIAQTPPLTDQEIVTLQRYIATGLPIGEPLKDPISREIKDPNPTITLKSPGSYKVPREGIQYWQVHTIKLPAKTLNLSAISITPNKPRALRSAQFYLLDANSKPPSSTLKPSIFLDYPGAVPLGNWSPGYPIWQLPADTTRTIAPGTQLVVVTKYQPSGREEDGGFTVNLTTQPQPAENELELITFQKPAFEIQADDAPTFTLGKKLTQPAKLIGLIPQARFYCGIVTNQVQYPNAPIQNLLTIQRWDPYWIGSYLFQEPLNVPAGTDLRFNFTYFNDDRCEMNANKNPETIVSGPTLENELCRMHVLIARPR